MTNEPTNTTGATQGAQRPVKREKKGLWASASRALTGVFDTVVDVAKTAQQSIAMASDFVDHKSQAWEITVYETTVAETAKTLREIKLDLEGDEELADIHADLAKNWKRPARR